MKPGTGEHLAKASECLDAARKIITLSLPSVAAKEAYLATYHAAHAFAFENTGKLVKTHSGMRSLFALTSKDDPRIASEFGSLLAQAYKYTEVADYAVGSQAVITMQEAETVIDGAARFIETVTGVLSTPRPKNG